MRLIVAAILAVGLTACDQSKGPIGLEVPSGQDIQNVKPLSENQLHWAQKKIEANPNIREELLRQLRAKGYDTSPLETPSLGMEVEPARIAGRFVGALVITFILFHAIRLVLKTKADERTASKLSLITNALFLLLIISYTWGVIWGFLVYLPCLLLWLLLHLKKSQKMEYQKGEGEAINPHFVWGIKPVSTLRRAKDLIKKEVLEKNMKGVILGALLVGVGYYWFHVAGRYRSDNWIYIPAVFCLIMGAYILFKVVKRERHL